MGHDVSLRLPVAHARAGTANWLNHEAGSNQDNNLECTDGQSRMSCMPQNGSGRLQVVTLAAGAVHLRCDACLRPCGEGARSVVTRLLLSVIRVPRTLLLD